MAATYDITSIIPKVEEALEYAKISKLVHKITSKDDITPFQQAGTSPIELHHYETTSYTAPLIPSKIIVKSMVVSSSTYKYVSVVLGGPENSAFWNVEKSSLLCEMGPGEGNGDLPFEVVMPAMIQEKEDVVVEETKAEVAEETKAEVPEENKENISEGVKELSLIDLVEASRDEGNEEQTDEKEGVESAENSNPNSETAKDEPNERNQEEQEPTAEKEQQDEHAEEIPETAPPTEPTPTSTVSEQASDPPEPVEAAPAEEESAEAAAAPSPPSPPPPPTTTTPTPSESKAPLLTLDIHSGINTVLFQTNLYSNLETNLNTVLSTHAGHKIILTGFGIGGAIATVLASYLSKRKPISEISVVNFGSPRIGSEHFGRWLDQEISNLLIWRFVLRYDYIAGLPSAAIGYRHVGHMMHLEDGKGKETKAYYYSGLQGIGERTSKDGYFKPPELLTPMTALQDPIDHHDINAYIQFLQKKSITNPKTYYASEFERTEESAYQDKSFLERCLNLLDKTCGSI